MSYYKFPVGSHVRTSKRKPQAIAVDDGSSMPYLHTDLQKQMEYRGDALQWTGWLVSKDYLDVPNEQVRPIFMRPDPVPIKNPRFPQEMTGPAFSRADIHDDPITPTNLTQDSTPFYVVPPPPIPEDVRYENLQNVSFTNPPFDPQPL